LGTASVVSIFLSSRAVVAAENSGVLQLEGHKHCDVIQVLAGRAACEQAYRRYFSSVCGLTLYRNSRQIGRTTGQLLYLGRRSTQSKGRPFRRKSYE
jgi:hypothetical protein